MDAKKAFKMVRPVFIGLNSSRAKSGAAQVLSVVFAEGSVELEPSTTVLHKMLPEASNICLKADVISCMTLDYARPLSRDIIGHQEYIIIYLAIQPQSEFRNSMKISGRDLLENLVAGAGQKKHQSTAPAKSTWPKAPSKSTSQKRLAKSSAQKHRVKILACAFGNKACDKDSEPRGICCIFSECQLKIAKATNGVLLKDCQ